MDFVRRHILERVAGQSVAQVSDLVIAVKRVDRGRLAGRLVERAIDSGNRWQPRRRHIFPLRVRENNDRDVRRIAKGAKAYN